MKSNKKNRVAIFYDNSKNINIYMVIYAHSIKHNHNHDVLLLIVLKFENSIFVVMNSQIKLQWK